MSIHMNPIGVVQCSRQSPIDDQWDKESTVIELDATQVSPAATLGLADFSHLEVVYLFDRVDPEGVCRGARHPRGRTDWPLVGILAQRAKDRPNRIGITTCRIKSVSGLRIEVLGLDAIDGTPILDIKPYLREFAPRGEIHQPAWVSELMKDYF